MHPLGLHPLHAALTPAIRGLELPDSSLHRYQRIYASTELRHRSPTAPPLSGTTSAAGTINEVVRRAMFEAATFANVRQPLRTASRA